MKRVAVIGAGIAGLTCAFELQRAGLKVDVYEREARVGGRMSTRFKDGLGFDLGALFLNSSCREITRLANELGVALRDVSPVDHLVYRNGVPAIRWASLGRPGRWRWPNFGSIRDVSHISGLRLWTRIKFLVFVWQTRWWHRTHVSRAARGSMDLYDLSSLPSETNTEDSFSAALRGVTPEFAYILDAYLSFMMLNRASEISKAVLLSLFSQAANAELQFNPLNAVGFMQALPDALAGRLRVRCGAAVSELKAGPEGGEVAPSREIYDRVVVATTAGAAARFLPEGPARQLVARARYGSTINVSFRIPAAALGRTQCFYVPFRQSSLISGFTNEEVKPGAPKLVNVGLHEAAAQELMGRPDSEIFAVVRSHLLGLHSGLGRVSDGVVPHDLQRWSEAIPKYDCAHIARVREYQRLEQGRGGLYLCGDHMNGPWLEGASRSGRQVAAQILSERSS